MIKASLGMLLAFLVGAGARILDIPVPAPPQILGALLVLAMTVGFLVADLFLRMD